MTENRYLRFDVSDELGLAGFYLMAHWPESESVPEIERDDGHLVLCVDTTNGELAIMQRLLQQAVADGGGMIGESATAFLKALDDLPSS
jgi:hypothetical protein